jgi:hypothetical protein
MVTFTGAASAGTFAFRRFFLAAPNCNFCNIRPPGAAGPISGRPCRTISQCAPTSDDPAHRSRPNVLANILDAETAPRSLP